MVGTPECKNYDKRALCLAGPQSCSRHPKVSWSVSAGEIRLTRVVRSQVSECSRPALALGYHYEGGKSKRMPPQRSWKLGVGDDSDRQESSG